MSISRIARFAVSSEHLNAALQAIEEFVQAVETYEKGSTELYRSFQSALETNRFLHVMTFADAQAEEAHRTAEYTKRFVKILYPICEEEPSFEEVNAIG